MWSPCNWLLSEELLFEEQSLGEGRDWCRLQLPLQLQLHAGIARRRQTLHRSSLGALVVRIKCRPCLPPPPSGPPTCFSSIAYRAQAPPSAPRHRTADLLPLPSAKGHRQGCDRQAKVQRAGTGQIFQQASRFLKSVRSAHLMASNCSKNQLDRAKTQSARHDRRGVRQRHSSKRKTKIRRNPSEKKKSH